MKRLKIRLQAVWEVLTTDFILISDIKRFSNTDGIASTSFSTLCRTNNSDEHDFLVLKGATIRKYNKLPDHVKADNTL